MFYLTHALSSHRLYLCNRCSPINVHPAETNVCPRINKPQVSNDTPQNSMPQALQGTWEHVFPGAATTCHLNIIHWSIGGWDNRTISERTIIWWTVYVYVCPLEFSHLFCKSVGRQAGWPACSGWPNFPLRRKHLLSSSAAWSRVSHLSLSAESPLGGLIEVRKEAWRGRLLHPNLP